MPEQALRYKYGSGSTDFWFHGSLNQLKKLADQKSSIILTDENLFNHHGPRLKGWNTIVIKAGEEFKVQATVDEIISQMIDLQADRKTTLIGIGGGVLTDLAGYVAAIYMRGIRVGYVPTTVLGLVDASIGGKNGVDVGEYKNLAGTIRQPAFILHDLKLLASLPDPEWVNGFAEIIKHAAILDLPMFRELEAGDPETYRKNPRKLAELVRRNAMLKAAIVKKDEFEQGPRRLLNFGHTLGHALETQYELSHGQAISIGMTYAAQLSANLLDYSEPARLISLLEQYGLPTFAEFDKARVFQVLKMDKKRASKDMNYVLLKKTGRAQVESIPLTKLEKLINRF